MVFYSPISWIYRLSFSFPFFTLVSPSLFSPVTISLWSFGLEHVVLKHIYCRHCFSTVPLISLQCCGIVMYVFERFYVNTNAHQRTSTQAIPWFDKEYSYLCHLYYSSSIYNNSQFFILSYLKTYAVYLYLYLYYISFWRKWFWIKFMISSRKLIRINCFF